VDVGPRPRCLASAACKRIPSHRRTPQACARTLQARAPVQPPPPRARPAAAGAPPACPAPPAHPPPRCSTLARRPRGCTRRQRARVPAASSAASQRRHMQPRIVTKWFCRLAQEPQGHSCRPHVCACAASSAVSQKERMQPGIVTKWFCRLAQDPQGHSCRPHVCAPAASSAVSQKERMWHKRTRHDDHHEWPGACAHGPGQVQADELLMQRRGMVRACRGATCVCRCTACAGGGGRMCRSTCASVRHVRRCTACERVLSARAQELGTHAGAQQGSTCSPASPTALPAG